MASGLPAATGDILTASTVNGLVAFTINADTTTDYTAVLADAYQVLQPMNKATAIAFKIPTNARAADRKSTRLNPSHVSESRMPSSA